MIEIVFLAIGLIILLGFFSHLFFEKTKIPDVLILMSAGILLNQSVDVLNPEIFMSFAPYVGTLALIIILFDGGINLRFEQVLRTLPAATGFTLIAFFLTSLSIMLIMNLLFGWSLLYGLLLGSVVGGTSSAIVIPLVSKMQVSNDVKIILTLESTLTDVLCIISAIAIVGVISSGSADLKTVTNNLLGAFSIATFVAFIFGIVWIRTLARFHKMSFGYLLTVAITFILYAIVEFTGGNGAIAAFVFGLLLGNSKDVAEFLSITGNLALEEKIRSFNEEVSFFVRTFFFLYLGLIFNPHILNESVILMAAPVLFAAVCARLIPVALISKRAGFENCGILLVTMMPRGLAAAVLASTPEITDNIVDMDAKIFTAIVIMIILFTNVIATGGSFLYEKRKQKSCNTTVVS